MSYAKICDGPCISRPRPASPEMAPVSVTYKIEQSGEKQRPFGRERPVRRARVEDVVGSWR